MPHAVKKRGLVLAFVGFDGDWFFSCAWFFLPRARMKGIRKREKGKGITHKRGIAEMLCEKCVGGAGGFGHCSVLGCEGPLKCKSWGGRATRYLRSCTSLRSCEDVTKFSMIKSNQIVNCYWYDNLTPH